MRAASVNLNKRLGNAEFRSKLLRWLNEREVALLLAQEPWAGARPTPPDLLGYNPVGGNERTFTWIAEGVERPRCEQCDPVLQRVHVGYLAIYNCYLDAYSQAARARQLLSLRSLLRREEDRPVLVVGDFNLAPDPVDGLCDGRPSDFNSDIDRAPFHDLLQASRLLDMTGRPQPLQFTIVRRIAERLSQFRCDLALVSDYIGPEVSVSYDHSVRDSAERFTDHSAIIMDVPVTLPRASAQTAWLFPMNPESEQDLDEVALDYCPHKTAMSRQAPSAVAQAVVEDLIPSLKVVSILDYGCGRGVDVEYYRRSRVERVAGYDPHEPFGFSTAPSGLFDLVTVVFVLNVLANPWERLEVMRQAGRFVAPEGAMLVVTRSSQEIREQATRGNWKPYNDGYWSHGGKKTFQKGIDVAEIQRCVSRVGFRKHHAQLRRFDPHAAWILLEKEG